MSAAAAKDRPVMKQGSISADIRPPAKPNHVALPKPQAKRTGNGNSSTKKGVVYTSHKAHNDVLLENVERLYFKKGDHIADVTYGKGVFWKKLKKSDYHCYWSDIVTHESYPHVENIDFRKLPYENDCMDVVIFDPPYHHTGNNQRQNEKDYQSIRTTPNHSHAMILDLYKAGMKEALRVLKPGGLLLVKCADEIESGKQRRLHIEVWLYARLGLGFLDQDGLQLTQVRNPHRHHQRQLHAHNNLSHLWVFRKRQRLSKTAHFGEGLWSVLSRALSL